LTISVHTSKLVETIKKYPNLIKNEPIIDAITGVLLYNSINMPHLVPVFGIDNPLRGGAMGLTLTPTRIIFYYEDKENNHQFRAYSINKIENITLEVIGLINKENVVKLYMGGSFAIMKIQLGEGPDEFIMNVKKYMGSQTSLSNCNTIIEGDFIYCIKCGTKLPEDALFCMKCGEKLVK
jgi:hypothetical protein